MFCATLLFAVTCECICLPVCQFANASTIPLQDESPNDNSRAATQSVASAELPQNALWRLGQFGSTPKANGIYRLSYSSDGKYLAARNREFAVIIYDVKTQKSICEIELDERIDSINFSPDSEFFVTAGIGPKIRIWNTQNGKLESEIETDGLTAYFNEAGNAINVLGETHVETYSWPGVQMTSQRKWKNSGNEIRSAMSRNGRLVVCYRALKREVYQTMVIDLDEKAKFQLGGPTQIPRSVVISPNSKWVAATYRDTKVRLWDLGDPKRKNYTLRKHTEIVQSFAFSADSRFLISTSWDKTVIAWDLLTRQSIGIFSGHGAHVTSAAFNPIGLRFASGASGTKDCSVIGWNMQDQVILPSEKAVADKLVAKDFGKIWNGMGASSIKSSLRATSHLVYAQAIMLDELEKRLPILAASGTSGSIEEMVKQLEDPDFNVRRIATEQLIKIRAKAEPVLRRLLQETTSPEVKYRIGLILKKKVTRPVRELVETRRWGRIVFALEFLNTRRSQEMLKRIAGSYEDIEVSQEAMFALDRMEAKSKILLTDER